MAYVTDGSRVESTGLGDGKAGDTAAGMPASKPATRIRGEAPQAPHAQRYGLPELLETGQIGSGTRATHMVVWRQQTARGERRAGLPVSSAALGQVIIDEIGLDAELVEIVPDETCRDIWRHSQRLLRAREAKEQAEKDTLDATDRIERAARKLETWGDEA